MTDLRGRARAPQPETDIVKGSDACAQYLYMWTHAHARLELERNVIRFGDLGAQRH